MFHGAAFAALAVLAAAVGAFIGLGWVVLRDARTARRMERTRP